MSTTSIFHWFLRPFSSSMLNTLKSTGGEYFSVVTDSEFASESVNFFPVRLSPNPRIFGCRKWRFWNVCSKKNFHLISQIYTTKTPSECHRRHLHLPIDILQQQHSSACCLREVLIYDICGRLMYGYQTTCLYKHMFIILSSRIRNRVRIRGFF